MTVLNRIRRTVGLTAAVMAGMQLTGCGGGAAPQPTWVAPATPSAPAGSAAAPSTTARLARVTSACQLLPAPTVVKLLGGSTGTKLTAREEPIEKKSTSTRFQCVYGRGGQEAFALTISSMPDRAGTVTETIDAIAKSSGTRTTPVGGIGAGAVTFVDSGVRTLAAVVPYNTELRLIVVTTPAIVPNEKLAEVAQHVAQQI